MIVIEKAARSVKYKHKKFAGYDSKGRKRWRYYYDDPKGGGVKGGKEQEALSASVSVGDVFKSGDGHIKVLMVASDGRIVYEDADGKKVNTTEEKLRNKLLSEHKESIMDALEAGLVCLPNCINPCCNCWSYFIFDLEGSMEEGVCCTA